MNSIHDDRPHPVPPYAFLRWKENYFFIVMDERAGVHGVVHVNNEPLFNRSRFMLSLEVQGRSLRHAGETPLPADFAGAAALSDGTLTLEFREPHRLFSLSCLTRDYSVRLLFDARWPTFDFVACKTAAPELVSFQEVMTCGLNLPYNHQQQSLRVTGLIELHTAEGAGKTVELEGFAYRDHSWSMRSDNLVRRHVWTGLNFASCAFGIKTIESLSRPGLWAKEGYVTDATGASALRRIEVLEEGEGAWPDRVILAVEDMVGRRFTIEADVAGRHAVVGLHAEKPATGQQAYDVREHFCPLRLRETGERGVGLIELGRHPALLGAL